MSPIQPVQNVTPQSVCTKGWRGVAEHYPKLGEGVTAERDRASTYREGQTGVSSYGHGKHKRRIHAAGNHFIFSGSQRRIVGAEMTADGFAVDDRSKRAAEVAHMIASAALFNNEVIARKPERRGIIEHEVRLPQRRPFSWNRAPANDK